MNAKRRHLVAILATSTVVLFPAWMYYDAYIHSVDLDIILSSSSFSKLKTGERLFLKYKIDASVSARGGGRRTCYQQNDSIVVPKNLLGTWIGVSSIKDEKGRDIKDIQGGIRYHGFGSDGLSFINL